MRSIAIKVHNEIRIAKPRELVWDFTQNYNNRTRWDSSVTSVEVIQEKSPRKIRLTLKGNSQMTFVYKLDKRPVKTTLAGQDIKSKLIESAGGSWSYEDLGGQTLWKQTNTIVFKDKLLIKLFFPVLRFLFNSQVKKSMIKAKEILEKE